jgi:hypothetical protein
MEITFFDFKAIDLVQGPLSFFSQAEPYATI